MRGAIRDFIQATTPYKVCGTVADGVSALQRATDSRCDVILLHLRVSMADSMETAWLLRGKLPHIKVVGFSSVDLENRASAATGFHALIAKQDGLSKLVEALKGLMPQDSRG